MEIEQIKQAGLKVTAPRIAILAILEGSGKRHLSAEDVYKELLANGEEIGLATVYRVLTQFEGAGWCVDVISRLASRSSSSTAASTMTTWSASVAGRWSSFATR